MDPITTTIAAALATGVAGEATKTTGNAYESLKTILKQKFGADSDLIKAISHLEQKPDSAGRKQVLQEEIAIVKADRDPDVLATVQTLLDQINVQAGHELDIQFTTGNEATINPVGSIKGSGPVSPAVTPWQHLPRANHFTGRKEELAQLLDNLQSGQVMAVRGPAGIGKSALAAEAVGALSTKRNLANRFPDGVIYYNFYDKPEATLAMEQIARTLGQEVWPTPSQAARRALAERQALLVLDGVEDVDDLAAILALRNNSGVLLICRQGTGITPHIQDIPPLPMAEAVNLLQAWSGRTGLEQSAARQICELVGGLPLAIQLAGRYLAGRPEKATAYLAWLKDSPLAALEQDQRCQESVPLLIECGLGQVSELAQQALAVAGLIAPAPFEAEVIAEALAIGSHHGFLATLRRIFKQKPEVEATDEAQIPPERLALGELVHYGLLQRVEQRYIISHPLIHTYARQRLASPAEAIGRLVTYYTTLVGEQILLGLDGYATLDAERPHFMRVLAACVEQKKWKAAFSLAAAIEDYLDIQGYRTERVTANEIGLLATRKLGRRHNEGAWLGNLGLAYNDIGQVERAIEYYKQALQIAREVGDRRGEGNSLGKLGLAYRDLGQIAQTRHYLKQALAIFEEIDSPSAEVVRDWLAEFREG